MPSSLHPGGDCVDPAVLVLDELHLQAVELLDLLGELGREVGVVRDDDRVVDDDDVEVGELEACTPIPDSRVDANDVVARMAPESPDVVENIAGMAGIVVAQQQDRGRTRLGLRAHLRATM